MENIVIPEHIVTPLLYWYQSVKRDLPWRRDPTPYHVWISEIMLQQTRVEAVKGYYELFLNAYPDITALAAADDDALNKVWQGLGYYSRARNLKKAAVEVVGRYGGTLPDSYEALLALPGIGAYTAGAIASIAFGLPVPAVDGNVLRVVSRLCLYGEDIMKPAAKNAVASALAAVYPRTPEDASAFTQALMELGATVCGPAGAPHCDACPLAEDCLAHREKRETDFPVRTPKRPRTAVDKTVLILRRKNAYAIRRRPENGLLAGLWEFPSEDCVMTDPEVRQWLGAKGFRVACMEPTAYAKHIFTHIEWHMNGFYCVLEEDGTPSDGGFVWAEKQELAAVYALPSAFRAFLERIEADPQEI